jgi:glyoxylase-like metal-dependent hydrolase (beta-lactamase superfamily II)
MSRTDSDLVFQSWVFVADGQVVLVDPCTGNGRPHPTSFFDHLDVPFLERLVEICFQPPDIDLVVCTHLHHDHCGWNTHLRDARWVPTFPNARYILRQEELDLWGKDRTRCPPREYNQGVFKRSVQPVVEAGLADLITGSHRLTPGLVAKPDPGHTLGHQMLHLTSTDRHALFTGDCFHHPIRLVEPPIRFGDADNLHQTMATRLRLVELAVELDAMLIPAHLPAPHVVGAWREGDQTRFAAAHSI